MRDFRIVVATHGVLASGFLAAAEMICGPLEDTAAVGLDPSDSPETFRDRLVAALGDAGTTRPVLLLTDLAGGTPHNVSLTVARRLPNAVLISGFNLAVLIEAATCVDRLDAESAQCLVAIGREALVDLEQIIASRGP